MNITTVGSTEIIGKGRVLHPAGGAREDGEVRESNDSEKQALKPESTEPGTGAVDGAEDDGGARGVLRLLQEGHFKGVADVRLRINFHDEIAALERENLVPVAETGVTGLIELVDSQIASLIQEGGLDEESVGEIQGALDTFNAAMPQSLDEFKNEDISGAGDLAGRLRASFDEFISSVQAVFALASEPEIVIPEETIPAETITAKSAIGVAVSEIIDEGTPAEETPSFDFQTFVADLMDAFAAKLQELEAALNSIQVLPPLSEPHGNGAAYDKFLAIYNSLQGATEPVPVQPGVETVA